MRPKHLEKPTWDSMSKPEGQLQNFVYNALHRNRFFNSTRTNKSR